MKTYRVPFLENEYKRASFISKKEGYSSVPKYILSRLEDIPEGGSFFGIPIPSSQRQPNITLTSSQVQLAAKLKVQGKAVRIDLNDQQIESLQQPMKTVSVTVTEEQRQMLVLRCGLSEAIIDALRWCAITPELG